MTTIGSSSSVALMLLQQTNRTSSSAGANAPTQADLTSTASGTSVKNTVAVEKQPSQAQSNITDAALQLVAQKETEKKAQLIKALGQAFGVDEADFSSNFDYAQAVGGEIERTRNSPDGDDALSAISKQLGLDRLGISLDTMVKAITVPTGDEGKQLDAAIAKQFDVAGKERLSALQHASETLASVQQDENGVYEPKAVAATKQKEEDGTQNEKDDAGLQ